MSRNKYQYLIAGLPDLSLHDEKEWISVPDFREMLKKGLDSDDYEQVKLVFLRYDNENLVNYLEKGKINERLAANYRLEDFRNQEESFSSIIPEDDILPLYMVEVMKEFQGGKDNFNSLTYSHLIAQKYYQYIQENAGEFLRQYTTLEYDLANLLTYIESRNHAMDPEQFLTGSSSLTNHLREDVSRAMTKPPDFDLFTEIICYAELPAVAEKEMKYDELRWRMIDEMTFFEEFTIDRVLGYLFKMLIINRWTQLKHDQGEEKLRRIIRGAREFAISGADLLGS